MPIEPPEQRRTLRVLVAAQVLSGAGLAAGVTVGALLAQDMLGATSLAGLPAALFTIGSAAARVIGGLIAGPPWQPHHGPRLLSGPRTQQALG